MTAAVETMFYTGATPWHGLGTSLANPPTTAEAIEAAGLNWDVELRSLVTSDADGLESDHRLVVRSTDKAVFGTVGPAFHALQNRDAFRYFDPLVQEGIATLETAGALHGGSRVWILAKLAPKGDADRVSADDRVERYVLLAHGHDGSLAVRAGYTMIRVVCANTLGAALNAADSWLARILHTKSVEVRTEQVIERLAKVEAGADAMMDRYRAMRSLPVRGKGAVSAYLAAVFGPAEVEAQAKAAAKGQDSRKVQAVGRLMEEGRGVDLPGVQGTVWGLYNALTEYMTHDRNSTAKDQRKAAESRAGQNAWGPGAAVLSRAASDEAIRAIMEHSNAIDAARRGIELTDDLMDTITSGAQAVA